MNTFYYIENNEVKELKTVKEFEFIKNKVNKYAVEKKKDIITPDGYKLNGNKIELTAAKQKELDNLAKAQELEIKIQNKLREIAIAALEAEGKI